MRNGADYDLLLLAKLTPLKAALPNLPREVQAFTRTIIARIEDHLSGVKRLPDIPADDLQCEISWLDEAFDSERACLREAFVDRLSTDNGYVSLDFSIVPRLRRSL